MGHEWSVGAGAGSVGAGTGAQVPTDRTSARSLKIPAADAEESWVDQVNANRVGVRERLGEILVRKGRLSRDQLAKAVDEARANGVRLGTYLVDSKVLYEEDISIALADQYGLRYVVIDVVDSTRSSPSSSRRRLRAVSASCL